MTIGSRIKNLPSLPRPDVKQQLEKEAPAPKANASVMSRVSVGHSTADVFETTPARPADPRSTSVRYQGTTVFPWELDERSEERFLKASGGKAVVLPYQRFDSNRPPVVLVHGINGSAKDLKDVADKLSAAGRQVMFAMYDDAGTSAHENGKQVADALKGLQQAGYLKKGAPVDIVAHSLGGIVSRCALNYLQSPNWMGEEKGAGSAPARGDFGAIRVRSLDTPWDGFFHEPPWMPGWPAEAVLGAIGKMGFADMRGSSEMFRNLYKVKLEGVDLQNTAAKNPGDPDLIRSLPDLGDDELLSLVKAVDSGEQPEVLRTRNFAGALAQDSRFPALQKRVRAALADGTLSASDPAKARLLTRLYEETMPRQVGSHVSVAQDDAGKQDDAVDQIVRELGLPAGR